MAEILETTVNLLDDDRFLSQLSYKQLQQVAMSLKLPGNLKHSSMIAIIKARRSEDNDQVERIMWESRQLRNRARGSRTSTTSPVPDSLTMSPPVSPLRCFVQTTPLPLAVFSPNHGYQSASQSQQAGSENFLQTPGMSVVEATDGNLAMIGADSVSSQSKEFMKNSVESENTISGNISSDRSPDPLDLGSPSTYRTDSAENSIGSDMDPLPGVKDGLECSEKDTVAKDFTELKPVPPSELMDLSLPVSLLDSSVALRQTLGPDSPQDSLLHHVNTSLTQALVPYTPVEESMLMSNPPVNLCTADSTMEGQVDSSTSNGTALETEYAQAKSSSDHTPNISCALGESTFVGQPLNPLKRLSQECEYVPTKLQKMSTVSNIQPSGTIVSTVSSNSALPSVIPEVEILKVPKSLSVVTLPPAATTSAIIFTMTSMTSVPAMCEKEKLQISVNSSTSSSASFFNQSASEEAKTSTASMFASSKLLLSNSGRKTTRSSARSTKHFSPGLWPTQPKSNLRISAPHPKILFSEPRKLTTKSSVSASKRSASSKPNTSSKKSNTVKLGHQDIYVYPEIQFRPKVAQNQKSPAKRVTTNQICCAASNSRQNPNPAHPLSQPLISSTSTTSISALSTVAANGSKRLDQAHLSAPNVFATPTVPIRNQPNVAMSVSRPGRPESLLNFAPTNLPSFHHLYRDLYESQKYVQNRPPEGSHPFPSNLDTLGEPLPPVMQASKADNGPVSAPPLIIKPPQMDFLLASSVPPPFVGQNLSAVGQNLAHDSCHTTLRQMSDAPVYSTGSVQNRESVRRPLFNACHYDNQNSNQLAKPCGIPPDYYKDMLGNGQTGNHPLQMQNFPRMPYIPKPDPIDRPRTKDFFAEQRVGPRDLPKSLEYIYNYRGDVLSVDGDGTTSPKFAAAHGSRAVDSLFVSSGVGSTDMVYCYDAAICSVRVKPARSLVSTGSLPTGDRHHALQEHVPHSPNYSLEQSTEMYSAPLNSALNQPCQPSWFPSDPCLPAFPVNQYWPQAVNPQPGLRLTQPFRPVNQRNVPNHYFSPLKSLHVPNPGVFFNQPQMNNMGHQYIPQLQDIQSYQQRDIQSYQQRDVQSYQPPESFDKILPMQENPPIFGQDQMTASNQALNQCQNQIHQEVPDFHGRNDQLSLSMIYNYLTSTEQMSPSTSRADFFDNQPQPNQRPVYSRPVFPGANTGQFQQCGTGSAPYSISPQMPSSANATPARSKPWNGPHKNVARRQEAPENTTLTREAACASVSALRKRSKGERQKCINFENGCLLVLPLSQLAAHEEVCEYIHLRCPKETCDWNGRARKLATHVREAHRVEINTGTDSKHILPDIEALERVCFLQEVSRKLFVICVNCHGGVLYVSIQYIASGRSERPTSAGGCIEVLGHDGHPHSWRGKLLPYYQSVESLLSTANCLEVSLNTLGAVAGSNITLHISIRVYSGNNNGAVQQSN